MDALATIMANQLWYRARFDWGWFTEPIFSPEPAMTTAVVLLLSGFWLLFFTFFGLYRERYAASRFDELVTISKVVTVGILVLFFLLFIQTLDAYSARINLVFYWAGRHCIRIHRQNNSPIGAESAHPPGEGPTPDADRRMD